MKQKINYFFDDRQWIVDDFNDYNNIVRIVSYSKRTANAKNDFVPKDFANDISMRRFLCAVN